MSLALRKCRRVSNNKFVDDPVTVENVFFLNLFCFNYFQQHDEKFSRCCHMPQAQAAQLDWLLVTLKDLPLVSSASDSDEDADAGRKREKPVKKWG